MLNLDPEKAQADLDAAQRMSDQISLHLVAQHDSWDAVGKWVAIRLSDGGSDGSLYDTRDDAIRHQLHEFQCCYVKIPPQGMPAKDALRYLQINRKLYDNGFRMTDPEGITMPHVWPTNSNLTRAQKITAHNEFVRQQREGYGD